MPQSLLLLLSNAANARSDGDFLQALVEAWAHVTPGDHHSLIRRHARGNRIEFLLPGTGRLGPEHPLAQLFAKLWVNEHPLETHPNAEAFLKNGPGVYLRSQWEKDAVWRKRAHYRIVDKPQGIEDMISIFLVPTNGTLVTMHAGSFKSPMDPELLKPAQEFAALANALLLARGGISRELGAASEKLSRREIQVMEWVASGKQNAEIADLIGVSIHTVRKHLEKSFVKLGVENRTAAVAAFQKASRRRRR